MKNTSNILLFVAVVAAFFCACSEAGGKRRVIEIEPIIASRVTALNFETGDEIGLHIERTTGVYTENERLIYNGSSFVGNDLIWYDNDAETSTLKAYYPYQGGSFPTEFTLPTNQDNTSSTADLLGAVRNNVTPTSSAVSMRFYHLMARLVINVVNQSGKQISSVQIADMIPVATLDWSIPTASAKSGQSVATVTAKPLTAGSCYEAILVPQSAAMRVVITTDDGKQFEKSVSAELLSGKSYTLAVTLLKEEIAVTLSGEIVDWGDGGELGTNTGGNSSSDIVGDTMTIGGESYATRTIGGRVWMAENVRFLPEGATIGEDVWYPGDASKLATLGYLYNYATATNGICPEGWHVPTADELSLLIGADCGEDFFTPAGMYSVNATSANHSENKNYLISSSLSETEEGRIAALLYTTAGASKIDDVFSTHGLSLRCIKDAE